MKKLLLLLVFQLLGCQQLLKGEIQPVKASFKYKGAYYTTCGGAVEDWASCNRKAQSKCNGDYITLQKSEDGTGIRRELHFECEK